MRRKVLIGLAVMLLGFITFVSTRPATFHIERSTTIAAPADVAFTQVNDFHKWAQWSPYEKLDPQMTKTFTGPAEGVGASYSWKGNDKAGEGSMTIEKSDKPLHISIKLHFLKPFPATNTATFAFTPDSANPQATKATWAMDGNNNFVGKLFSLFVNVDKLVGDDFEKGLASLKTVAESVSKKTP